MSPTLNAGPGQLYELVWTDRQLENYWSLCHIPHHTTNNNVEQEAARGLTIIVDVAS